MRGIRLYFSIFVLFSWFRQADAASTFTWNFDGNADWNDATKWSPATGFPQATDDVAIFGAVITAPRQVTINGVAIQVGTINFDNANKYTIASAAGGTLQFSATGTPVINAVTGTHLIDVGATNYIFPSTLNINTQVSPTPAGIVQFGAINLGGATNKFFIARGTNPAADMQTTGVISNGTLNKDGGGILQLTGANQLDSTLNLIMTAGTLDFNNNSQTVNTLNGTGGTIQLGASTITINSGGTYSGTIAGTGNLIMQAGTLSLFGSNSYTGQTTQNGGTLKINNDNSLGGSTDLFNVADGSTIEIIDNASLQNTVRVVNNSTWTVNVDASKTGTFRAAAGFGVSADGTTTVGLQKVGAGTLVIDGNNANFRTNLVLFEGTVVAVQDNALGDHSLGTTFGITSDFPTGTLQFRNSQTIGSPSNLVRLSFPLTLSVDPLQTVDFRFKIQNTGGPTAVIRKDGEGTLQLTGPNSYDGGLVILNGTVEVATAGRLGTDLITFSGTGGTLHVTGTFSRGVTTTLNAPATYDVDALQVYQFPGLTQGTGPLNKVGLGTMNVSGTGSYTLATNVNVGTFQGGAINAFSPSSPFVVTSTLDLNSFSQTISSLASGSVTLGTGTLTTGSGASTTFSGAITGAGSLIKQGGTTFTLSGASLIGGTTTITGGRLNVNGSLQSSGGMTVGSGAILEGTGTVISNILVNGTISPGNSIGTLHVLGTVTQAAGSTLEIEVNPTTSDELTISNTYTINPGATLLVEPDPGVYAASKTYTIVATGAGVSGTFSTVTITLPTFMATVQYTPLDVLLVLGAGSIANVVIGGNAGAVARCLDTLTAAPGSDLELVLAQLRQIPTVGELTVALNLLQPSQFTALALAQENTTLYTNETIFHRLQQSTQVCPRPCKPPKATEKPAPTKRHIFRRSRPAPTPAVEEQEVCPAEKKRAFWVAPFGGLTHQHNESGQVGFHTEAGGITTGMDYSPWSSWTFGGAVGYSYINLKWEQDRGNSNMQNAYGALYAGTSCKHAYLFATAMGSYNHYDASRHISLGDGIIMPIDRHAKSAHHGWQGSGHLRGGFHTGKMVQFAPFIEADYIYVHEHSFNENGAKSLDLHVKEKNSDLLQAEAGFEISKCFSAAKNNISPSIGFSVIHEWRFMGKHEKSSFANSSCVMHTTGMNPDNRTLYSPAAGFTLLLPDENRTLSFEYKGKFGEGFRDNHLLAQFLYKF